MLCYVMLCYDLGVGLAATTEEVDGTAPRRDPTEDESNTQAM